MMEGGGGCGFIQVDLLDFPMIVNRRENLMSAFRRFWWGPDTARSRPGESFPTASLHESANAMSFAFGASYFLTWLAKLKQLLKHLLVMNQRLHMKV